MYNHVVQQYTHLPKGNMSSSNYDMKWNKNVSSSTECFKKREEKCEQYYKKKHGIRVASLSLSLCRSYCIILYIVLIMRIIINATGIGYAINLNAIVCKGRKVEYGTFEFPYCMLFKPGKSRFSYCLLITTDRWHHGYHQRK